MVLGAWQRSADAPRGDVLPRVRRGSGGPLARVGPGSVWVQLALASPTALVADADPSTLLNRYVRPLLRALTRSGALAHYFGRDWVSVARRPAGVVAFAHDAGSGRTCLEALVGVGTAFTDAPRSSFLGKVPVALAEVAPRATPAAVADAIAAAYAEAYAAGAAADLTVRLEEGTTLGEEPAWACRMEEAIGTVAAGRDEAGVLRLGGEWMASRDAVARVEAAVAALGTAPSSEAIAAAADDAFGDPAVALFGVRALASFATVLAAAR